MRTLTLLVALTAAHVASSEEVGPTAVPTPTPEDDENRTPEPTRCMAEDRATKWYDGCPCSMYEYSYWYNTDYYALDNGNAQDEVGFWGIDASNIFEQLQVYKGATADWTKHRYHPEDPTKGLEETTGNGMLTNGVVMEKAAEFCEISLKQLKLDLAGRHGTVNIQNIHAIMCSNYCLIADELHGKAMEVSTCNCLELSTQPTGEKPLQIVGGELQWHVEGDFCLVRQHRER